MFYTTFLQKKVKKGINVVEYDIMSLFFFRVLCPWALAVSKHLQSPPKLLYETGAQKEKCCGHKYAKLENLVTKEPFSDNLFCESCNTFPCGKTPLQVATLLQFVLSATYRLQNFVKVCWFIAKFPLHLTPTRLK